MTQLPANMPQADWPSCVSVYCCTLLLDLQRTGLACIQLGMSHLAVLKQSSCKASKSSLTSILCTPIRTVFALNFDNNSDTDDDQLLMIAVLCNQ